MRGESWPPRGHGDRQETSVLLNGDSSGSPPLTTSTDSDLNESLENHGDVVRPGGPRGAPAPWEHPLTAAEKRARLVILYDQGEKLNERQLRRAQKESAVLRSESSRWRAQASALRDDTAKLSRDRSELCHENTDLRGQNVELREQLDRLQQKLIRHRRRTHGSTPGSILSPETIECSKANAACKNLLSPPSGGSEPVKPLPPVPRISADIPIHPAVQAHIEALAAQVLESEERAVSAERRRAAAVKLYVDSAREIGSLRAQLAATEEHVKLLLGQVEAAREQAESAQAKEADASSEVIQLRNIATAKEAQTLAHAANLSRLQGDLSRMLAEQARLRKLSSDSLTSLLQDISAPAAQSPGQADKLPSPEWTPPLAYSGQQTAVADGDEGSGTQARDDAWAESAVRQVVSPAENRRSLSSAETCNCSDESSALSDQVLRVLDFQHFEKLLE
mmetsp:Transcript_68910/g.165400  ORF Transcript_68910/g.165400 Transcript_68910/m.165400 type:complete len:450 (+) Transcript_68910:111-1460(+)